MLKIDGKKLGIRLAVLDELPTGIAPMPELMVMNPVHDVTTIAFTLPLPGTVKLSILNVRGAKLAAVVDGEFTAGDYRVRFDASTLSPGTYICRLRTCRGVVSKLIMRQG
jgi:hypothetical protein